VPRKLSHLVLVNGVYAHPDERDTAILKDGDTLAIWPPVAGG
jgi:molybdopterin converting factor small subunit